MKIGILTFQQAINYGAVLQTYALQKILIELGHEASIIQYISPKLQDNYQIISFKRTGQEFLKQFVNGFTRKLRSIRFKKFVKRYMILTSPIEERKCLLCLNDQFDLFIVGSDQVWNFDITNSDETYLLDFVCDNSKKFSYAASFGVSRIPVEHQASYKRWLNSFSYITVRESQGEELIWQLCEKKAAVVLDPTLLLTQKDWMKVARNPMKPKYILVYLLGKSNALMDAAEMISRRTGYQVVFINYSLKMSASFHLRRRFKGNVCCAASPEEFLSCFLYAEYVLTNSFHGTAFSINFNKMFLAELQENTKNNKNSRLQNIMEIFHLEHRLLEHGEKNITDESLYGKIDYASVNQILARERERSLQHLNAMLNMAHE